MANKEKKRIMSKRSLIVISSIILLIGVTAIVLAVFSNKTKNVEVSAGENIQEEGKTEELEEETNIENIESIENLNINEEVTTKTEDNKNTKNTNTNKATSEGPKYHIKVNTQANVVTVYTKDSNGEYTNAVKAMLCSSGVYTPPHSKYPKTQYKITGNKYRWLGLQGNVFGQYATQIVGNILFHSVPYTSNKPYSLEYWEYDKLGTSASMGCIRLRVSDAKWIFNNISAGTMVEFYKSSNPGPLGRPNLIKISENTECRNWDPTDENSENPWKNVKNTIIETNNANTVKNVNNTNTTTNKDIKTNTTTDTTNTTNTETKINTNKTSNTENETANVTNTDATNEKINTTNTALTKETTTKNEVKNTETRNNTNNAITTDSNMY